MRRGPPCPAFSPTSTRRTCPATRWIAGSSSIASSRRATMLSALREAKRPLLEMPAKRPGVLLNLRHTPAPAKQHHRVSRPYRARCPPANPGTCSACKSPTGAQQHLRAAHRRSAPTDRQSPARGVVRRGASSTRPSHSSSSLDIMRIIACVLLLAATAFAGCSNSCSGHGTCSGNDKVSGASRRVGEGAPPCRSASSRRSAPAPRCSLGPPASYKLVLASGLAWERGAGRNGAGRAEAASRSGQRKQLVAF